MHFSENTTWSLGAKHECEYDWRKAQFKKIKKKIDSIILKTLINGQYDNQMINQSFKIEIWHFT